MSETTTTQREIRAADLRVGMRVADNHTEHATALAVERRGLTVLVDWLLADGSRETAEPYDVGSRFTLLAEPESTDWRIGQTYRLRNTSRPRLVVVTSEADGLPICEPLPLERQSESDARGLRAVDLEPLCWEWDGLTAVNLEPAPEQPDTVTPSGPSIASSEYVWQDVSLARGRRELTDESALTIASWWQSSGSVGSVLAALASGCTVEVGALLDDIAATRRTERVTGREGVALDMLATWALRHESRTQRQR